VKARQGLERTPVCGCDVAAIAAAARGQIAGIPKSQKNWKKLKTVDRIYF